MVIRGNSRGNGRQLAYYLLAKKDNEAIRVLDIDGFTDVNDADLRQALYTMNLTSELTKSEKGLYHAQINPAIGEDALMGDAGWLESADILGKQLGLENQRRAIVLHTKKGRTHAHVVWERYDHEQGKMVSDSFSRLAQDRARKEMEATFGHQPTPHRNKHRPELKASLTELWNQTGTGKQFVNAAKANGYLIAEGSGRSPYVVVDENGRSYDLARQLQNVRLKEVRQRLRSETLLGEKDAIIAARNNQNNNSGVKDKGKGTSSFTIKSKTMQEEFNRNKADMTASKKAKKSLKEQFAENKKDVAPQKQQAQKQSTKGQFKDNRQEITGQPAKKSLKEKFADNKKDITGTGQTGSGKGKASPTPKPGMGGPGGKGRGPEMG